MNDSKKINKDKVRLYLMDNGTLAIGEDAGKYIKNAIKIVKTGQDGIMIASFFKSIAALGMTKKVGLDIDKRSIHILAEIEPFPFVISQYEQYIISDGNPQIEAPKQNMN
jgi:hypothetical protein